MALSELGWSGAPRFGTSEQSEQVPGDHGFWDILGSFLDFEKRPGPIKYEDPYMVTTITV